MFHRVPYLTSPAMAAGIAVLTLVLAILSPSPSLLGTAHAQNTNNAPTFDDGATTTREVEETPWYSMTDYPPFMENNNRNAGAPIAATDTDSGDTLTYSLDGTNAEYFKIDESSGQIRTKEPLDYENDPAEYTVTVSVHDGKDSNGEPDETIDATITVTITLTDVNEPPKPSRKEGEPQPDYDGDMEFTIPENTTGPMVFFLKDPEGRGEGWLITGLASDIDSNLFDYEEDVGPANEQQILFKEPPDYENPKDANKDNVYTFNIMLYDTYRGENHKVAQTYPNIKVRGTDVKNETNENPAFEEDSPTRSIAENSDAGVNIGDPVSAEDPDDNPLTYTLDDTSAELFDIDASTGQLKTKAELDHETTPSYTVTISVKDGFAEDTSEDNEVDDTIEVIITVTDANDPPDFTGAIAQRETSIARSVPENTAEGEPVGDPVAPTDADSGDTLTYALAGTDASSFEIDTETGQIKTKAGVDLDYEAAQNTYSVTVSVHDGKDTAGNTEDPPKQDDTVEVTIAVTDVNEPPAFADDAPLSIEVAENTATNRDIGNPYTATDPDAGETLTYSLSGTDAASFDIDTSSGQLKTKAELDHEAKDSYRVTIQATDGKDAYGNTEQTPTIDDTLDVTITVTDVDDPGAITFSSDSPAAGTTLTATLDDDDGVKATPAVTWAWESSTDQSSWTPVSGETTDSITLDSADVGNYYLVTATYDDEEGTGQMATGETSNAVVTAPTTNQNPEFARDAATTLSVAENTPTGQNIGAPYTASHGDSKGTVVYSLGGTAAAEFELDTTTGQLKTKTVFDYESGTTSYSVTISVTDGLDDYEDADTTADATINVTITVDDVNEPPMFDANAPTALNVLENTATATNITNGLFTATDPDSDAPEYSLATSGDSAAFAIDSTSGQLKSKDSLDFETKAQYTVRIYVTDNKAPDGTASAASDDTHTVTINVTNADDDGTVTFSADPPSAGTALTATLNDDDNSISGETWSWKISDDGSSNWREITGAGTNSYTPQRADIDKYLQASVSYTDSYSSGKSATGTTGAVADRPATNQHPSFADATADRSVAENTVEDTNIGAPVSATHADSVGTLVYSLDTAGATNFDIDSSTGQLKTKTVFDYENDTLSYTVTVSVRDGMDDYSNADSVVDHTIAVTINVTNVNEPPEFDSNAPTTLNVVENTAAGENIGTVITATDPDNGDTVTYSLDGQDGGAFEIDSSGQIKTKDPLDRETKSSYSLTVTATDSKSATATHRVTITVTDEEHEPPRFDEEYGDGEASLTREVAENTAAGQPVGAPVSATDDDGDTLTYSLVGTDATSFDIDTTTGQIKAKDPLDYEDTQSYSVTVSVTDSKDSAGNTENTPAEDASIDVTINVTNVNEGPAFADDAPTTLSVDENTVTNTDITDGRFTATDPESDTPTYSLSGTDAASFDIDTSTGELKTKADLDHEDKNRYSVTIQVTDGKAADGNTENPASIDDTHDVTITVTDVDDDGAITISADPPSAGTTLTATLTDDDGIKATPPVAWKWESSPNGTSSWTPISGETTNSYTPGTDDVDDYLRVTATYDDEEGSGKTAEKVRSRCLPLRRRTCSRRSPTHRPPGPSRRTRGPART